MKVIIEHKTTKRKIEGAFNICGSKQDLLQLAHQIIKEAEKEFHYGWISIVPERQPSITNTEPSEWE